MMHFFLIFRQPPSSTLFPYTTLFRSPRRPRSAISPRPDPRTAPLSFIEWQMWLMDQMAPGNPAYNLPRALRLRGPLDIAALAAAVNTVIGRHEILRPTCPAPGVEPHVHVHTNLRLHVAL